MGAKSSTLDDVPYEHNYISGEYIAAHVNDYIANNIKYQKSWKYKKYDVIDEYYDSEMKMLKSRIVLLKQNLRSITMYYENGNPGIHNGYEGKRSLLVHYYKNGYMKSHELFKKTQNDDDDNNNRRADQNKIQNKNKDNFQEKCPSVNDVYDGRQYYYYENGYLQKSVKYNNGQLNGKEINYDKLVLNKVNSVVNYKNGLKHGESIEYIRNKISKYENYHHGKLHGKCYRVENEKCIYSCYQFGELLELSFLLTE